MKDSNSQQHIIYLCPEISAVRVEPSRVQSCVSVSKNVRTIWESARLSFLPNSPLPALCFLNGLQRNSGPKFLCFCAGWVTLTDHTSTFITGMHFR